MNDPVYAHHLQHILVNTTCELVHLEKARLTLSPSQFIHVLLQRNQLGSCAYPICSQVISHDFPDAPLPEDIERASGSTRQYCSKQCETDCDLLLQALTATYQQHQRVLPDDNANEITPSRPSKEKQKRDPVKKVRSKPIQRRKPTPKERSAQSIASLLSAHDVGEIVQKARLPRKAPSSPTGSQPNEDENHEMASISTCELRVDGHGDGITATHQQEYTPTQSSIIGQDSVTIHDQLAVDTTTSATSTACHTGEVLPKSRDCMPRIKSSLEALRPTIIPHEDLHHASNIVDIMNLIQQYSRQMQQTLLLSASSLFIKIQSDQCQSDTNVQSLPFEAFDPLGQLVIAAFPLSTSAALQFEFLPKDFIYSNQEFQAIRLHPQRDDAFIPSFRTILSIFGFTYTIVDDQNGNDTLHRLNNFSVREKAFNVWMLSLQQYQQHQQEQEQEQETHHHHAINSQTIPTTHWDYLAIILTSMLELGYIRQAFLLLQALVFEASPDGHPRGKALRSILKSSVLPLFAVYPQYHDELTKMNAQLSFWVENAAKVQQLKSTLTATTAPCIPQGGSQTTIGTRGGGDDNNDNNDNNNTGTHHIHPQQLHKAEAQLFRKPQLSHGGFNTALPPAKQRNDDLFNLRERNPTFENYVMMIDQPLIMSQSRDEPIVAPQSDRQHAQVDNQQPGVIMKHASVAVDLEADVDSTHSTQNRTDNNNDNNTPPIADSEKNKKLISISSLPKTSIQSTTEDLPSSAHPNNSVESVVSPQASPSVEESQPTQNEFGENAIPHITQDNRDQDVNTDVSFHFGAIDNLLPSTHYEWISSKTDNNYSDILNHTNEDGGDDDDHNNLGDDLSSNGPTPKGAGAGGAVGQGQGAATGMPSRIHYFTHTSQSGKVRALVSEFIGEPTWRYTRSFCKNQPMEWFTPALHREDRAARLRTLKQLLYPRLKAIYHALQLPMALSWTISLPRHQQQSIDEKDNQSEMITYAFTTSYTRIMSHAADILHTFTIAYSLPSLNSQTLDGIALLLLYFVALVDQQRCHYIITQSTSSPSDAQTYLTNNSSQQHPTWFQSCPNIHLQSVLTRLNLDISTLHSTKYMLFQD